MKLICCIILIFLTTYFNAQTPFAPLNSYWNYNCGSHNGSESSNLTFRISKDTLESGTLVKEITVVEDRYYSLNVNRPVGIYSYRYADLHYRNDSVFYNNSWSVQYLYNFNMQVGDTVIIIPSSPNLIAVVDTVYSVVIDGDTLRKWGLSEYCENVFWKSANIVEGIGPIDDFLFWNYDGCVIGGFTYNFQCYHSDSISYNSPCLPLTSNIGLISKEDVFISLYPLPANEFITIKSNTDLYDVRVRIFDIYSQIVSEQNFIKFSEEQIDLSNIKSGYYFISINSPNLQKLLSLYRIE